MIVGTALARGAERPNFVWKYDRTARAIVDGDLPTAQTVALAAARTIDGYSSSQTLFEDADAVPLDESVAHLDGGGGQLTSVIVP